MPGYDPASRGPKKKSRPRAACCCRRPGQCALGTVSRTVREGADVLAARRAALSLSDRPDWAWARFGVGRPYEAAVTAKISGARSRIKLVLFPFINISFVVG